MHIFFAQGIADVLKGITFESWKTHKRNTTQANATAMQF
jgi:hypothetical protein